MRARDIREVAVGHVLEAARNPRRGVILHVGDIDDFCKTLAYEPYEIRAGVVLAEEVDLNVGVRIVAENRTAWSFDGDDMDAARNLTVIVDALELIQEPLVDV